MKVLTREPLPSGKLITSIEQDRDEDLMAYYTDRFYRIEGHVFTGHQLGMIECVYWDTKAQAWLVAP